MALLTQTQNDNVLFWGFVATLVIPTTLTAIVFLVGDVVEFIKKKKEGKNE